MPTVRVKPGASFTLVELLVVVAIIAVLASLLLPSLHKAKQTAKTAVCLGNLRQNVAAAIVYAGDNDYQVPLFTNNGSHDYARFLTNGGYLSATPARACPSGPPYGTKYGPGNISTSVGYGVVNSNTYTATWGSTVVYIRSMTRLSDPGKTMYIVDSSTAQGAQYPDIAWGFPSWAVGFAGVRHFRKINAAVWDGHAEGREGRGWGFTGAYLVLRETIGPGSAVQVNF